MSKTYKKCYSGSIKVYIMLWDLETLFKSYEIVVLMSDTGHCIFY